MKILRIFISGRLFLSRTFLWKSRQDVSHNISLSPTIIDSKIALQVFLGLANLTKTQVLCIHELIEVIMVSKNKDLYLQFFK